MEIVSDLILSPIADAMISSMTGVVAGAVLEKLRRDPARKALKVALGQAMSRYAADDRRLDVAAPLFQKAGVLADPEVVVEFARILRFEREQPPDADLIGRRWKAQLTPSPHLDFTTEARRLLRYVEEALRRDEVFRPAFTANDLAMISERAEASEELLKRISADLVGLQSLVAAGYDQIVRKFRDTDVRSYIRDYTRYIEEKTRGFVGRRFVFDEIDRFIHDNPCGVFIVRGDPGIGKTALAAQMVKMEHHVHHFIRRGIGRVHNFQRNICAQLIAQYDLGIHEIRREDSLDSHLLEQILNDVSEMLGPDGKTVIVVDALDEADSTGVPPRTNALYLPHAIPEGIYLVITSRSIEEDPNTIEVDCEQEAYLIQHDGEGNMTDIREYIMRGVDRPGTVAYMARHNLDPIGFAEHMALKSHGNFMYLHYVLPDIERGLYQDLDLKAIPDGLADYYLGHWYRMRDAEQETWFKYKLPVIVALSILDEPQPVGEIAEYAGIRERARVEAALEEWSQFLHVTEVSHQGELQKRYMLYHPSFQDFLFGRTAAARDDIADTRRRIEEARDRIADILLQEYFPSAERR